MTLLAINNLTASIASDGQHKKILHDISITVQKAEIVSLVGESGSGKSITALSVMQLLSRDLIHYPKGSITFKGKNLLTLNDKEMRHFRGDKMAMIFQEPMSALNPLHHISKQIIEMLMTHQDISHERAKARCLELLEMVELDKLKTRLNAFPHELSGGQRQRVMIAMAIANNPDLLIADEPTTALDVMVEQEILSLLLKLHKEMNMSILLITHDLGIVKQISDRTYVLKQGKIVEENKTKLLFSHPKQAYTHALISAFPEKTTVKTREKAPVILKAEKLNVAFPKKKNFFGKPRDFIKPVQNIDITLKQGQTLGIVGESGSGKTTLALALLRLIKSSGAITLNNHRLDTLPSKAIRPLRQHMQIVFQDPFSSLNPRMSIEQILAEGLFAHRLVKHKAEAREKIATTLKEVQLDPSISHRYPHEFSGGQRQRIAIARALILRPELIVFDEPTSALDLSVQKEIITLLQHIQKTHLTSYIFISHDLQVVRALSHHIAVLKEGRVVEYASSKEIFTQASDPYTKTLIRHIA